MIKLQFREPHAPEWDAWRQEVAAELAALQAHGPPYQVKDSLYKKQRETIFACYLNKCAYCEGHYRLTAKEGDVEHFRPKGRVRDRDKRIVTVVVEGKKGNHPGYWWLAYEPINLLPSCALCNRTGKGDYFPLEPGSSYALQPGAEAQERPLLVHPGLDDPDEHLRFDPAVGVLAALTPKGEQSIETFLLNREDLLQARLKTYRHVAMSIHQVCQLEPGMMVSLPATLAELNRYKSGEAEYSIVGRQAMADFAGPIQELKARLAAIFDA